MDGETSLRNNTIQENPRFVERSDRKQAANQERRIVQREAVVNYLA